jgi:hypothetical protein
VTPQPIRDPLLLRSDFRQRLEKYLAEVHKRHPQFSTGIHETLRSQERQEYLWKIGREPGYGEPGRVVTWTRDSNHRYGIAADWHLVQGRQAIWDDFVYAQVYRAIPPGDFDLESLAPREYVHLQLKDADKRRVGMSDITTLVKTVVFNGPIPKADANERIRAYNAGLRNQTDLNEVLRGEFAVTIRGDKLDLRRIA